MTGTDLRRFCGSKRSLDREGKIELNSDGTVSVEWWLRWMSNTFTKVDG
jgi:hypothetical protein